MPVYDYQCASCDKSFEISHKMSEMAPLNGPGCARQDCCLQKQLSLVAMSIRSANPLAEMSKASSRVPPSPPSDPKPEHQCSTGCAMHRVGCSDSERR